MAVASAIKMGSQLASRAPEEPATGSAPTQSTPSILSQPLQAHQRPQPEFIPTPQRQQEEVNWGTWDRPSASYDRASKPNPLTEQSNSMADTFNTAAAGQEQQAEQTAQQRGSGLDTDYLTATENWLRGAAGGRDWTDFRVNGTADEWYNYIMALPEFYNQDFLGFDPTSREAFDSWFNKNEEELWLEQLFEQDPALIARLLGNDAGGWSKQMWELTSDKDNDGTPDFMMPENGYGIMQGPDGAEYYNQGDAWNALNEELLATMSLGADMGNLTPGLMALTGMGYEWDENNPGQYTSNDSRYDVRTVPVDETGRIIDPENVYTNYKNDPRILEMFGDRLYGNRWRGDYRVDPAQMDLSSFNPIAAIQPAYGDTGNRRDYANSIYEQGVFDQLMAQNAQRYGREYGWAERNEK